MHFKDLMMPYSYPAIQCQSVGGVNTNKKRGSRPQEPRSFHKLGKESISLSEERLAMLSQCDRRPPAVAPA